MTALVNPNEEAAHAKSKEIYCMSCGELNIRHEDTVYLRCHRCHRTIYASLGDVNSIDYKVIDYGSTQDGDWIKVRNSRTREISTYWKEG